MGWLRRAGWLVGPCLALSVGAGCAAGSPSTDGGGGEGAESGVGGATSASSAASTSASTSSADSSSSQSASSAEAASSSSSSGGGEGGSGGGADKVLGDGCGDDAECVSGLCKDVLIAGADKVCVTPCAAEAECGDNDAFFCNPIAAGSAEGYCVPRSPAHCLSCAVDADCGSLSERCFQAPGDIAPACHVDCSIGGEDACPQEYTCESLEVDGVARKLCRPSGAVCLDANGGFCDRVTLAQTCQRNNESGTCVGQRECQKDSKRFGPCGATAPQCKGSCSEQDPAGCALELCAAATSTPEHCGACNSVCPGLGEATANVSCDASQSCMFSCKGENYDVNENASDGCEIADSPKGNHETTNLVTLKELNCNDGESKLDFKGMIPSDARVHDPPVEGFNATTGAAPDYFKIKATGGTFCQNNLTAYLTVQGAKSAATCYRLSVDTSDGVKTCTWDGNVCKIEEGAGSYDGGTFMYFKVEKTCSKATATENVTYAITGHL